MPRVTNFSPYFDSNTKRWVVSVPPKLSGTGRRKRESFRTRDEAERRGKQLRGTKERSIHVVSKASPELIEKAVEYDELFRVIYGFGGGLVEACEQLMKSIDKGQKFPSFGMLVEEYEREHGSGWSKSYRTKWSWFNGAIEELKEQSIGGMNGTFWGQWLDRKTGERELSDGSYNDLLAMLRSVWKQAVGLDLTDSNPIEGIRRRKTRREEKKVYSPAQARAIMECCWEHDRDLVPFFGLALFAGLRPDDEGEIAHLDWEDINFEEKWIEVGKQFTTKTGSRRFVDLEDNLAAWMAPWKGKTGPVIPKTNLKDRRRWVLRGRYQSPPGTQPKKWKALVPSGSTYRDVTRHSYGSYFDAKYRDRNRLKENMGHRNFETYEQYYRNARSPKESEEYWGIFPSEG